MSNISTEHEEKLQQLIYSEDFESVLQGLDLLDTLTEDKSDIYDVFDLTDNLPLSVDELGKRIFECEHQNYIKVWILGKLAEYNTDWVCNLTELDLSKNKLTLLSESIRNLTNLKYVNVKDNPITNEEERRLTKIFGRTVHF